MNLGLNLEIWMKNRIKRFESNTQLFDYISKFCTYLDLEFQTLGFWIQIYLDQLVNGMLLSKGCGLPRII
jgi:hypothetical protein